MRVARVVRIGMAAVATVSSGTYFFVYLYRWEWHRATVAGLLLVATEVAIVGYVVVERLRRLEDRLDRLAAGGPASAPPVSGPSEEAAATARQRVRQAAPSPPDRFGWLSGTDRLGVFVPILLGAGVLLSAVAWLVERLARATAGSALEAGLARRLVPLTVPAGTLERGWGAPAAPPRPSALPRMAAAAAVAVALVVGIDVLGDATQNRPDAVTAGRGTDVVLLVDVKRPGATTEDAARNLWGACAWQLGTHYRLAGVVSPSPGTAVLAVEPPIGRYAERRFTGCVHDATTDAVRATVQHLVPRR